MNRVTAGLKHDPEGRSNHDWPERMLKPVHNQVAVRGTNRQPDPELSEPAGGRFRDDAAESKSGKQQPERSKTGRKHG